MTWPLVWRSTMEAWRTRAEEKARDNTTLRDTIRQCRAEHSQTHAELAVYKRMVANLRLDQDELQSRMDEAR